MPYTSRLVHTNLYKYIMKTSKIQKQQVFQAIFLSCRDVISYLFNHDLFICSNMTNKANMINACKGKTFICCCRQRNTASCVIKLSFFLYFSVEEETQLNVYKTYKHISINIYHTYIFSNESYTYTLVYQKCIFYFIVL